MKTLSLVYLSLAIIAALVAAVRCYWWIADFGCNGTAGYLVANTLPVAAFLLAYVIGRRQIRRSTHAIMILSCLAVVVFSIGLSRFIEFLGKTVWGVTRIDRYEAVLDEYWHFRSDLVEHFPRPIPEDATDIRFSFAPAFLQGGAHIQLRYTTDPATISSLYARFSKKATRTLIGGNKNRHMNAKDGMPTTSFFTSGSDDRDFPDDYELLCLDQVIEQEDRPPGSYWNHGASHGVAISKKRNAIVYWAELW